MFWQSKIFTSHAQAYIKMIRMKPGLISWGIFSTGFGVITYQEGQNLANEYLRYALAGTSAILIVEVLVHPIDTLNMRSKVLTSKGKKINVLRLFKLTDMMQLGRGLNAVVYGYAFSSMLYFYSYATLKKQMYSYVDTENS